MKKTFALLLVVLTSISLFAQRTKQNGVVIDQTAQKIVEAISKTITAESPLKMDFTMTVTQKGKQSDCQKGTFVSHGSKFKLISTDYEDYSDGTNLWHFVKKNNEVELSALDSENNVLNIAQMIKSYAKDYRPKLIREENRSGVIYNVIDLVPKGKSSITKIRIVAGKKNNRISEMTINIREGNTYKYNISRYEAKTKVQPSDFTFPKSKYPSAEIIDLR